MAKKSPNPIDVHVGTRIRTRRLELGISQEKLADGLGLTFQQVQKYEKGTNRVGASRLQAISAVFKVPISFFFEGASPPRPQTRKKTGEAPPTDFVTEFLANVDTILIKAFLRIKEPVVRRSIVRMIEAVSGSRTLIQALRMGQFSGDALRRSCRAHNKGEACRPGRWTNANNIGRIWEIHCSRNREVGQGNPGG